MGILEPISINAALPVTPLTQRDCDVVLREAYVLMCEEKASAIGIKDDRLYIVIFDCRGEPYVISRTEQLDYAVWRNDRVAASGQDIEALIAALKAIIGGK